MQQGRGKETRRRDFEQRDEERGRATHFQLSIRGELEDYKKEESLDIPIYIPT